MASISQPSRPHSRSQRGIVWLLLLVVGVTLVGISLGMLQPQSAGRVSTPAPLPSIYDDEFFSLTSGHTQLLQVPASGDATPALDTPQPFSDYWLQFDARSPVQPGATDTPPPAEDYFLPFPGAAES